MLTNVFEKFCLPLPEYFSPDPDFLFSIAILIPIQNLIWFDQTLI